MNSLIKDWCYQHMTCGNTWRNGDILRTNIIPNCKQDFLLLLLSLLFAHYRKYHFLNCYSCFCFLQIDLCHACLFSLGMVQIGPASHGKFNVKGILCNLPCILVIVLVMCSDIKKFYCYCYQNETKSYKFNPSDTKGGWSSQPPPPKIFPK